MRQPDRALHRLFKPAGAAVAAALDDQFARLQRIAQQGLGAEGQRPIHPTMQHQPVPGRVDVGCAVVVAHEVQAVRRERAPHALQRCPGRTVAKLAGNIQADAALHLGLMRRGLAIAREGLAWLAQALALALALAQKQAAVKPAARLRRRIAGARRPAPRHSAWR